MSRAWICVGRKPLDALTNRSDRALRTPLASERAPASPGPRLLFVPVGGVAFSPQCV